MIVTIILFATLGSSIKFPKENKPEKMQACYNIIGYKLNRDQDFLTDFFKQFNEPNFFINYYTADMLLKCYTTITLEEAKEVLMQEEKIYLEEYLEDLVRINITIYTIGKLDVNSDHEALYDEIKNLLSSQEGIREGEYDDQDEQSPIGIETFAFIGIVLICTALAYLASGKTENKVEEDQKDE
ncbi:hypothetical protein SteCoe_19080 [Stentor coeruleus]|uniref:Uncharacterized protein n=1 Tax=Stentor coeruleus TaxID=5963 RepID=A0A1R2BV50_9CILI|nr:hypothetical protein SteCoe_19080 [Stentor coeruleus]